MTAQESGIHPFDIHQIQIEHIGASDLRICEPHGKIDKAQHFVGMSEQMETAMPIRCGQKRDGWLCCLSAACRWRRRLRRSA